MSKRVRMKAFKGWCLVCNKTGAPWYGNAIMNHREDVVEQHWNANDGSGKHTRIARVRVQELLPKRRGGGSK